MNLYDIHPDPENAPYREWAFDRVPELVWETYRDYPAALKEREKALAKAAHCAYFYALYVLKRPFPAGEAAIAKEFYWAYHYARDVLKGPFPAGEPAIVEDADYRDLYAIHVLGLTEHELVNWGL